MSKRRNLFTAMILVMGLCGCSVSQMAVSKIGDALASGNSVFETDDDIRLIGDSLHEFMVIRAGAKPGKPDFDKIEKHYRRALELSQSKRASLFVAQAESVAVARHDKAGFESALKQALAVDADKYKEVRLLDEVAHRRAEWLLARTEELILTPQPQAGSQKQGESQE